jgi:hypothetical protein
MTGDEKALYKRAYQELRELAFWAETSSGPKPISLFGAIAASRPFVTQSVPERLPEILACLRQLVLWCRIVGEGHGHTFGHLTDRAERFLTESVGQPPVLADATAGPVIFTEIPGGGEPVIAVEISVGTSEFTAAGANRAEALDALAASLEAQAIEIQKALIRVLHVERPMAA